MKKFLLILSASVLLFLGCQKKSDDTATANDSVKQDTVIVSQNNDTTTTQINKDSSDQTTNPSLGKEYTSKYICPMHCKGSGSDKPGNCPVCGMEYIENPDYQGK